MNKKKIIEALNFGIEASASSCKEYYLVGFRNGMRYAKSLIDGEEPEFEQCESNKGEWVLRNDNNNAICSKCFRLNRDPENFCKFCGADMRGDK